MYSVQALYKKFVSRLENVATGSGDKESSNYTGNVDLSLHIRIPVLRKIVKEFIQENKRLSIKKWKEIVYLLNDGKYDEEKTAVGEILKFHKKLKNSITPKEIKKLLKTRKGWLQVDTLCQTVFTAEDINKNWEGWRNLLLDLRKSTNINERRASLVLLTKPINQSEDKKFSDLAFENIDILKKEKDKLITKAVSWLLRVMIKYHKDEVERYLNENEDILPSVAIRETRNKLETGKK